MTDRSDIDPLAALRTENMTQARSMPPSDRSDSATVTLRWERGRGLCIRTRLPGDVSNDMPVSVWQAPWRFIREVRWLRGVLRSGEVVR
jgi:hypothetical protein